MFFRYSSLGFLVLAFLSGCATLHRSPASVENAAELTPSTYSHHDLTGLPEPLKPAVVAVYGVRDQTGQFKPAPDSNFSTAVTQGASAILVKILEDSKWFIPVERESLQNLLTERKIIRSIEQQPLSPPPSAEPPKIGSTVAPGKTKPHNVPPPAQSLAAAPIPLRSLITADYLLEGGIVGYESNVQTGGVGAQYFGIGLSTQYRVDQVTVNLRIVDVYTGVVLSSVMTTKTIYSQEIHPNVYRFLSFQRLLEIEGGISKNEPTELCIHEALEAAVIRLVIRGVEKGLWKLKHPDHIHSPLIQRYLNEKSIQPLPIEAVKQKEGLNQSVKNGAEG
jgi:curli production assembly/transport component CsgG